MRITFVSPFPSLAGGIRVKAVYAKALQNRGNDVKMVTLRGKVPTLRARVGQAIGLGEYKRRSTRSPLFDFLGDHHIELNHNGPITAADVPDSDVVIATFWETAPWVADLPASKGRKFYLLQDYETFKVGKSDQVSATYDLPLKKIAVSEYIAEMLAEHHDIHDVAVVPNAVDCTQFNAPPRDKGPGLTVGFLYTGKPRKNVAMAIEVLERAKTEIPDLQAVAFGSIAPLDTLPLPDWMTYQRTPPQEELAQLYGACDAWLFTSLHEGFGLPILEAMACRTPVLATSAGAAPQIINGRNGSLLEPTCESFLAELHRFAQMPAAEWRAMSQAAYETAHSYGWEDATDLLLEALRAEALV